MNSLTKKNTGVINAFTALVLILTFVLEISKPLGSYAESESYEYITTFNFVTSVDTVSGVAGESQNKRVDVLPTIGRIMAESTDIIREEINRVYIVAEIPANEKVYINTYKVNLREEPSTRSKIIGTFVQNDELSSSSKVVTNRDEEWVKVEGSSQTGYIMQDYITTEPPLLYMGEYVITYYCPCEKCCGVAGRTTASGVMPVAGRTVAADATIPFGTKLVIDGHEYVVEDRGGAIEGNHIDIFHPNHDEAFKMSKKADVYRVKE